MFGHDQEELQRYRDRVEAGRILGTHVRDAHKDEDLIVLARREPGGRRAGRARDRGGALVLQTSSSATTLGRLPEEVLASDRQQTGERVARALGFVALLPFTLAADAVIVVACVAGCVALSSNLILDLRVVKLSAPRGSP
jgi:hypothetical protein